jgi:hypothetical protein
MEDASRSTLANASDQVVHALDDTTTQFASHPSTIAAVFRFVPGLMMGVQEGLEE